MITTYTEYSSLMDPLVKAGYANGRTFRQTLETGDLTPNATTLFLIMGNIEALGYKFVVCRRRAQIYVDHTNPAVAEQGISIASVSLMQPLVDIKSDTKQEAIFRAAARFCQALNNQEFNPDLTTLIPKL